MGWVKRKIPDSSLATTYATFSAYNALGQPGSVAFGNSVQTTLTYHDQNFHLLRRLTTKATSTYQDMRYGYDPGGNVTAIVDPIFSFQSFRYDDLDRLISATGPYSPQPTRMFGYDKIGNLTLHCTLGDLAYPASGVGSVRPHAVCATGTTSCASPTYQYDANGNLTSNPALSTLLYDFENRPTSITKAGGATTTMSYSDLLGRVTKTTSGSTTTYVGSFYECVGGTCTKYIFAGDQRIAKKEVGTATVTYFQPDHLGSSSVLTKGSDGTKDEQLTYYPFGQTRTDTDGSGTPLSPGFRYKYTDQEFDDSTGLYYYRSRYYDPVVGRFIQPDILASSLSNPQSLNRYSYVMNNPVRYTDPTGHQSEWAQNLWLAGGLDLYSAIASLAVYNSPATISMSSGQSSQGPGYLTNAAILGIKDIPVEQLANTPSPYAGLADAVKLPQFATDILQPFFQGTDISKINMHPQGLDFPFNLFPGVVAHTASATDIYFRQGYYRPDTTGGLGLIGHELEHTVQRASTPDFLMRYAFEGITNLVNPWRSMYRDISFEVSAFSTQRNVIRYLEAPYQFPQQRF